MSRDHGCRPDTVREGGEPQPACDLAAADVSQVLAAVAKLPRPSPVPLGLIHRGAARRRRRRAVVRAGATGLLLAAGIGLLTLRPLLSDDAGGGGGHPVPAPPAALPAPRDTAAGHGVVGHGVVDDVRWSLVVRTVRGTAPAGPSAAGTPGTDCQMQLSVQPADGPGTPERPAPPDSGGRWFPCPPPPDPRLETDHGDGSRWGTLLTTHETGVPGLTLWLGSPGPNARTGRLVFEDGLTLTTPVADVPEVGRRTYALAWNTGEHRLAGYRELDADGRTLSWFDVYGAHQPAQPAQPAR
ncbi:hypothetical protein [Streptomyces sp. WAC06614]|uniref:hypothetical protein n=1 Tax=Streptomyces sp. WAC06614 TaxID=2487416 RepID=UPI000F785EDB|nr:hypothetical protein [Streptomyces sp. WAC06614]RSS83670.1 hypothetical protein EF918_02975 [Streptomyces sp. WAC06614]